MNEFSEFKKVEYHQTHELKVFIVLDPWLNQQHPIEQYLSILIVLEFF